jgi:hypothetical protein
MTDDLEDAITRRLRQARAAAARRQRELKAQRRLLRLRRLAGLRKRHQAKIEREKGT